MRLGLAGAWLAVLLVTSAVAHAAPYGPFNRPQDSWRVAETRYFRFYFTDQTPATAAHLMAIADATFERLNRFYRYQPPRKITVTVVGYTSYSNGFADSLRNRITIFPTPPDFYTRSRVPWLDNVFTHELSHILSLNAATYWFSRVPLVLGTGVARTDTTQTLVRAPIYGRNYPHWFIEGVAQFDTERLGRDSFDENRAAYQRAALEDGMLFPLGKTAFFGGEQWYNSGLSFLDFLDDKFGEGTVHKLFRAYGERYYYVFDELFEDELGQSLSALEAEFRAEVVRRFEAHRAAAAEGLYDGKPLVYEGQEQAYWELSSAQRDYQRDSYRSSPLRFANGKLFFSQGGVIQYADFSPTDRSLQNTEALGQGSQVAPNGPDSFFLLKPGEELSLVPYVYRPDFESSRLVVVDTEGNERELLHESRLMDFDVCKARSELAGVYNDGDGNLRLALYAVENFGRSDVALADKPRFVLPERPFDEVRSPRYSPDCKKLLFSRRIGRDHDLFAYDFASGRIETVSAESAFELYPAPARDGVYYVSARDGSMSIYFRRYDGGPARRITAAVTGHHNPVVSPQGLFFARLYGTGFQTHFQPYGWSAAASEPPIELALKETSTAPAPAARVDAPASESYNGFAPDNILSPTFVPMLDLELDSQRSYGDSLRVQAGLEMFVEDQLGSHALLFRGYLGNRSSFLLDYQNDMTPLSLRVRGGMTDTRSLYVFRDEDDSTFEHVTDYRWGFLTGSVGLQLNFYYRLTALADTVRDIGSTVGARSRSYDWLEPRYARNLYGLRVDYKGIDRNDPTFRERDVNKRGYRESDLGLFYAQEDVHPLVAEAVDGLHPGISPYFRGELHHTEYVALPALGNGFFDHTLQIDAQLGFISRDIRFLPFLGGGRLYALTTPELNTSVGFVGYDFYSVRGETLLNLALSYRFPLARNLAWDWGPLYLEDIYAQVFTSWGNIWGFDADGDRQLPFRDRAENGRYVLGDVGLDIRFWNFFQEVDTNVGATLRAVYRLVPFTACPEEDVSENPSCLGINADPGPMFYFLLGGGF